MTSASNSPGRKVHTVKLEEAQESLAARRPLTADSSLVMAGSRAGELGGFIFVVTGTGNELTAIITTLISFSSDGDINVRGTKLTVPIRLDALTDAWEPIQPDEYLSRGEPLWSSGNLSGLRALEREAVPRPLWSLYDAARTQIWRDNE